MKGFLFLSVMLVCVAAKDPAEGWLGYATASCPPGSKITKMSAYWTVLDDARPSSSFYSPWFGIDTSDNMNLLQPVNPWFGSSWSIYTEYFQWSPVNNINSQQLATQAGNQLYGEIKYQGDKFERYHLAQNDLTQNVSSTNVIPVQRGDNGYAKNYTIAYVVFEKVAPCADYPPNQKVTFSQIEIYCDYKRITPEWTTAYVDDVCNNRAHVVNASTIEITWSTNHPDPPLAAIARSQAKKRLH